MKTKFDLGKLLFPHVTSPYQRMWKLYGLFLGVAGAILLVCGVAYIMVAASNQVGIPSSHRPIGPRGLGGDGLVSSR